MAGQVLVAPRWQNHAVEMVTLKALYNNEEIAFYLVWDDPFEDRVHDASQEFTPEDMPGTYAEPFAEALVRKPGIFRDAIALQLPVKAPDGPQKPHFFRGGSSQAVELWTWEGDRDESSPVHVVEARGFERPLQERAAEQQTVAGRGVWKEGQWHVVMKRSLTTEASGKEAQFELGRLIPVALQAWEGSNGEHGMLMSMSTWHFVYLKPPTRASVYLLALLGIAVAAAGEWWLVRRRAAASSSS